MKIIRHTARDMRAALRGVREQLGEDAVILSSRRTGDGVEVTAAVDFDASTLEAGGFSDTPPALAPLPAKAPPAKAAPQKVAPLQLVDATSASAASRSASVGTRTAAALSPTALALTGGRPSARINKIESAVAYEQPAVEVAPEEEELQADPELSYDELAAQENPDADFGPTDGYVCDANHHIGSSLTASQVPRQSKSFSPPAAAQHVDNTHFISAPVYGQAYDAEWISDAAREAVAEHLAAPRAPVLSPAVPPPNAPAPVRTPAVAPVIRAVPSARSTMTTARAVAEAPIAPVAPDNRHIAAPQHAAPAASVAAYIAEEPVTADRFARASYEDLATSDPVEATDPAQASDFVKEIREATLTPLASNEVKAAFASLQATAATVAHAAASPAATEAMGNELKTLRRMLENQLAHLAWNDLTRRAPVHTEILRELTEIGITQDLAEHLVRQLPEDTDLTFARRFTIAGLAQYLKVTGDRWLDDGGRVAFVGATGVGKTTTLAKIAVRWVLRHGPRDIALVAADSVRIGAQDQLTSLAQLLGVPVYTPQTFEQLPVLLSRLSERLILIDTPGASVRDSQLPGRLAVLSNAASKLETALVLATSTQTGAIEEAVRHFAPVNPACCVLTKLDEAASLGGLLSTLIRARLPVSYMSEGQRVPEDLRPARALELVSAAVRLAKARGAAADEDLLRRRFGKTAHGIS
jgi:flagellar biosynthesis protein FlhF